MKRKLWIGLAMWLMLALLCFGAAAEEVTDSGECGENASYMLTGDGTLRITGTGLIEVSFFESREDIIHVIIGEGITGTEYRAFGYCENLLDVSLPTTFTVFENSCFYDCTGLTSVIIPEGTETIGYEAFGYCTGLERVTLPASLQSIDDEAFDYGCRSLTDVYYGGTMAQWGNVEIGDGNNHLMTATIHCQDGDIENSVRMEVKNGVLTISGSGYMGDIPEELARSAREVVIGAGVTNGITRDSFEDCNDSIASYTVETGNPVYESAGGALFRKNPSTLILYPGDARSSSFTVPAGVKIIGEYAFQGNEYLSSITLPEGLEKIGNAALFHCTALESITIPASVTFIDPLSNLERCSSLTRIDVAEGNTEYKSVNGVLFTEDLTCLLRYPGGRTDTAYTVPAGTTRLGEHAFLGNTILTSVTLPEGVEYMENLAFYECTALTEVTLPVSLTEIEDRCFNGCPNLRDVYYAGTTEQWSDIQIGSDNQDLKACVIHCSDGDVEPEDITGSCGEEDEDSVTYVLTPSGDLTITGNGGIGYGAFARNSRVIRVFIGSGITKTGDYAFDGCSGLKEITLPASLTEFGYRSFHGCDALETVYYEGTIEQWIELAYSYPGDENPLTLLKAVCADGEYNPAETVIDSGECGENATYTLTADGCMRISGTGPMYNYDWDGGQWADESKIKSVIIEEGITTIGDLAFYSCDNLKAISMPDSLTRIGDYGLYICDLESVTIPKNVVYVGIWAFSANFRLTEIKVAEGNQYFTTYDGALYNKDRTTLLICPAGKQSYTVPEGVTNIDQAFQACHKMIQVVLPEGLTRIGGYTFSNLSELTSVTIPGSMRSIEFHAFGNCESLTDIYYNGTIAEWGQVGIGEDNGPLFADQCTIHCTDGDTKAEPRPAGMELGVYAPYSESGFYFAPGLSIYVGRMYSSVQLFTVYTDSGNTERPAGKPVWTFEQTAGTALAEVDDGTDINTKYIRLKTMPTQEETAVWHVTCKWGGQTLEKDLAITFREAPSLPTGIEYTGAGPWKVATGERLEIDRLFRFSDGWSLPGVPVRVSLLYSSREFSDAYLFKGMDDIIAKVPGAYSARIAVQCANINLIKDMMVYFTDTDGVIPWGNYVSPAKKILELPEAVTDIPAETFRGTAAQAVILPENCVSIGAYAFADSPELTEVRLPETLPVSGIDEHAFDGCTGLTVIVARTAEQITWAKENGYIPVDAAE